MGNLMPRSPEDLLPATQVRARYQISDMTLFRWLNDSSLKFPEPIRINRRRYWRLSALQAFEFRQAANRDIIYSYNYHSYNNLSSVSAGR